jgi:hypothetical protein
MCKHDYFVVVEGEIKVFILNDKKPFSKLLKYEIEVAGFYTAFLVIKWMSHE